MLPDPAYSGFVCVTEPFGFPAGTVTSKQQAVGAADSEQHNSEKRRAGSHDRMQGTIRGFAQVALRRALSEANGGERRELVRRFKHLSTDQDARVFIYDVKRQYLRSRVREINLKSGADFERTR